MIVSELYTMTVPSTAISAMPVNGEEKKERERTTYAKRVWKRTEHRQNRQKRTQISAHMMVSEL